MSETLPDPADAGAEQVYSAPADALAAARRVLADAAAPPRERADALWVLGRSAYYANHMSDAVRLLREAAALTEEPAGRAEILLTLAPALSKEGDPEEALRLLEDPALEQAPSLAGQLRNQRGVILTELGRLQDAMDEMEDALRLLREAGDDHREARTLVNLGAVASMLGRLDEAEAWYELAREKTLATGQHVVAAGIEGNLGYVASRRGNFAVALDWYARARASFDGFGDVDLLVAVLEVDHARTLLDVGLAADAADASERAASSAESGGNQMLETQARVLLAESLARLDDPTAAAAAAAQAAELASRLGQDAWALRAAFVASEFEVDVAGEEARGEPTLLDLVLDVGWSREAFAWALRRARRLRAVDADGARRVLVEAGRRTDDLDVDPVDRAAARLLLADLADDPAAASTAFDDAVRALAEQRSLLGSVEMRATIAARAEPVREIALAMALRTGDAERVLDVLERTRAVRHTTSSTTGSSPAGRSDLEGLRAARVALAEAKLDGGDVPAAADQVRRIERRMLATRRTMAATPADAVPTDAPAAIDVPDDTAFVTYTVDGDRLVGLVRRAAGSTLVRLGPVADAARATRMHRRSLRRLADARRGEVDAESTRLREVGVGLGEMLIEPLRLDGVERLVVTPPAQLRDVAWSALPGWSYRAITVAPTLSAWARGPEHLRADRLAVIGGPGLDPVHSELDAIGTTWGRPEAVHRSASCDDVCDVLRSSDLVHVAAHGTFRADNPFFSALQFSDGLLSILEMSELGSLPAMVVLASCDAAASAPTAAGGDVVVGTATELLDLGVDVVVAPSVPVDDEAAGELSRQLHSALAAGRSIDDSVVHARSVVLASADPRHRAAGHAFAVFGGRATQAALSGTLAG